MLLAAAQINSIITLGSRCEAVPLGMNKDGREKDTDARRWRRRIDDPRRGINPFPVAIRPINTPALHIAVSVISKAPVLVTTVVMSPHSFRATLAEGRRHVYTADHRGQDKPHHHLAHDGSETPCA